MTSARQIYLGSRRGPALPYDAEVEYLESQTCNTSESAYILFPPNYSDIGGIGFYVSSWVSTDYIGANPLGRSNTSEVSNVYSKYSFIAASNYFVVSGSISGNGNWGLSQKHYGELEWDTRITKLGDRTLILRKNGSTVFSDERRVTTPFSMSDGAYFRINSPQWNNATMARQRIRRIVMYEYDSMVTDMIPVRFTNELGQSEGAMYDRVSGQLFRNSGTGAFGFGTDIAGGGINV